LAARLIISAGGSKMIADMIAKLFELLDELAAPIIVPAGVSFLCCGAGGN